MQKYSAKIGANIRVVQSQSGQSIVSFFCGSLTRSPYSFPMQTRRMIKKTKRARKTCVDDKGRRTERRDKTATVEMLRARKVGLHAASARNEHASRRVGDSRGVHSEK